MSGNSEGAGQVLPGSVGGKGRRRGKGGSKKGGREMALGGCLGKRWTVWKAEGASERVVQWLKKGIEIRPKGGRWKTGKPGKNWVKGTEEKEWMEMEIQRWLEMGRIKERKKCSVVLGMMIVDKDVKACKKEGNWERRYRMVVLGGPVNRQLPKRKFREEGLSLVDQLMEPGWKMVKLDLECGYGQLLLSKKMGKEVGIHWGGKTYGLTAMWFGMSLAPWCFTLVMREAVKMLRKRGMRVVMKLDDMLIYGTEEELKGWVGEARELLVALGLRFCQRKSFWKPQDRTVFLGMVVDGKDGLIRVPEEKRERTGRVVKWLLEKGEKGLTAREWAKGAGLVGSLHWGTMWAKWAAKEVWRTVGVKWEWREKKEGWETVRVMRRNTKEVLEKVKDWLEKEDECQVRTKRRGRGMVVVVTDASDVGWGAVAGRRGMEKMTWGKLNDEVIGESSGVRELEAMREALRRNKELVGKNVLWRSDSKAALGMWKKGGKSGRSWRLVGQVLEELKERGIQVIRTEWVKGKENMADPPSRWGGGHRLKNRVKKRLERIWGTIQMVVEADGTAERKDQIGQVVKVIPEENVEGTVLKWLEEEGQMTVVAPDWWNGWRTELSRKGEEVMDLGLGWEVFVGGRGRLPWINRRWNWKAFHWQGRCGT